MSQFTKQNSLQIVPIPAFKDNYIWAIYKSDAKEIILVDPGDAAPCIQFIEHHKLTLNAILITHHHPDHVGGLSNLITKFPDVAIYGPQEAHNKGVTTILNHNEELTFDALDLKFRVSHVPGHTLGHIAYFCEKEAILFCGDTLFSGGCGRLFEGTHEQLQHSLTHLASLPSNTKVYCTHEYTLANLNFALTVEPSNLDLVNYYNQVTRLREQNLATLPSTIGLERSINPFLRCEQPEIIESTECYTDERQPDPLAVFTALRQWKDNF